MNGTSHQTLGRFLSACLLLVVLTCQAKIGVEYQMQLGNPTDAKPDRSNHEHYLIQRSVLAEDYDDERGEPNWVAWDLTADDMGPAKRTPAFHPDSELPASFHHITSAEYKQSGFDRGHMCPSADRTDNAQDNELVFAMSNIIPQSKDNNEGVWEHLESYCREQAQTGNELLIISGPAGFNGDRIPNGPVLIPSHTWKIIVEVPNGSGSVLSRITPKTAEASKFYDETMIVTGKVAKVSVRPTVTLINLDEAGPNSPFTAVIFPDHLSLFPDIQKLQGQNVEISGTVTEYRNKPEIILESTNQLKVGRDL